MKSTESVKNMIYQNLDDYESFIEGGTRMNFGALGSFTIPDANDIAKQAKDAILGPVENGINNSIINPVNKVIKDGVAEGEKIVNKIIDVLQKGVNGFFDIILIVVNFINQTAARFVKMGKGMNDIFTGLFVTETNALGEGLKIGFNNIGELFKWSGEFIFSYINCGVQYAQNLNRCLLFYIIDAFVNACYLPIRIILWFMKTYLYRDLYGLEEMIWDKIYEADAYMFRYVGVHFALYPKAIRDLCYNCKRMKIDALKNKVRQINYDFGTRMPTLLQKGVIQMKDGSNEFAGAFKSDFKMPPNNKPPINPNSIKAPVIPTLNAKVGDVIPKLRF